VLSYLRLVRLPNVFTAIADVVAGFLIVHGTFSGCISWWTLLPLAACSACLYLAGMACNDIADREEDARVRPKRVLPSGALSLRQASACGAALLVCGVASAAAAGAEALTLALALAASVLCYDFAARRVPGMGPAVLGLCRFLNVSLGLSAFPNYARNVFEPAFWRVYLAPALAVGVYAAGLTAFSAQEEAGKRVRALALGWVLCATGLALAGATPGSPFAWGPVGLLALALLYFSVALARAGSPRAARNLVRTGVLGICVLDAGLVLGHGGFAVWPYALGITMLVLPSLALGQWLAQREA